MESTTHSNIDISNFLDMKESMLNPSKEFYSNSILINMLQEGLYTDVTFKVEGGLVKAHRCVLASVSPVFNEIFKQKMQEQLTSNLEIFDMTIESLQIFLILLYDSHDVMWEHIAFATDKHFDKLLQAYNKYQVTKIKWILISTLRRILTPENCWNYYKHTSLHVPSPDGNNIWIYYQNSVNQDDMDYVCYKYIVENSDEILRSNNIIMEMRQNPNLLQSFFIAFYQSG